MRVPVSENAVRQSNPCKHFVIQQFNQLCCVLVFDVRDNNGPFAETINNSYVDITAFCLMYSRYPVEGNPGEWSSRGRKRMKVRFGLLASLGALAHWTPAKLNPGQQLTCQANNNAVLLHCTFCSS